MVKVSVEVRSGASRFRVAVSTGSVRRALRIPGGSRSGRVIGIGSPGDPVIGVSTERGGSTQVERSKSAA